MKYIHSKKPDVFELAYQIIYSVGRKHQNLNNLGSDFY